MKVLVIGGTGRTGRLVVEALAAAGHAPVVLSRSSGGDVLAEGVLSRAVEGVGAVVTALSIPRASRSPFAPVVGPTDLHSRSTRLLIDALRQRGVRRLVKVSAQGVGDSAPRAGWGFRALVAASNLAPAFADHAVADDLLRDSDLDWTIVRPPMLADGPATGRVQAGEALTTWSWTRVRTGDVAAWVVGALDDPETFQRVLTLR